jgi:alpha-ketoglutarate-dependent taurine dioxygenase
VIAWRAGDLSARDLTVDLPRDTVGDRARLAATMATLRDTRLVAGPGAFVISGESFAALPDEEQRPVYEAMLGALGEFLPQNDAGDRIVKVVDEGQRMTAGGRYHKSNEGGEIHTDGPQYDVPPRFVGLRCVRPAASGGASKLVSAHAVHEELTTRHPGLLRRLYDHFHFHQKPGPRTVQAPIFMQDPDSGALRVRYLGEYVRSGHAVAQAPLDAEASEALDALDAVLADEQRFAVRFDLGPGDVLIVDNHRVLHGREAFRDPSPDAEARPSAGRREMWRLWVR